jgi:hypothetical protein
MRDISTNNADAAGSEVIRPILMADFDFVSGHIRVHTGAGPIGYAGSTFNGIGDFGKISALEENALVQASGLSLTLSGIDPDQLSIALGEHYQGRALILYVGMLDSDLQLVDDPVILWQGRMDTMMITLGGSATITITAQNPLADWDRPRVRRYNNDDQQARYPGDKGLEYVEKTVNKEILWGA